jgi:hypothetical protein
MRERSLKGKDNRSIIVTGKLRGTYFPYLVSTPLLLLLLFHSRRVSIAAIAMKRVSWAHDFDLRRRRTSKFEEERAFEQKTGRID